MTLDDQLRVALSQEAETRNVPGLDVQALIGGGQRRRRRRNATRAGIGCAVAVLIGGGFAVARVDHDSGRVVEPVAPTSTPTGSPSPTTEAVARAMPNEGNPRLSGTYRVLAGITESGTPIEADWSFRAPGWRAGNFPVASEDQGNAWAGVGVYRPFTLAEGTGCQGSESTTSVGRTPHALAVQLAHLPRSTVLVPPTPTETLGHLALHLRLQVDVRCAKWYQVADTARGDRGITYGGHHGVKNVVIDFWVLDVDGTPVVVDEWHNIDASAELVGRATQLRESIRFVPAE